VTDYWRALRDELDAWGEAGRTATFWWRDDDAVAPSAALDRLCRLSTEHRVPLGLAVIPQPMTEILPEAVLSHPHVSVLQHGFAHVNHAKGLGRGAWELGVERPEEIVLDELDRGRARLEGAFGVRFVPVVAPPWNKIADALFPGLRRLGFAGVTTWGLRATPEPLPGFRQANIHWDLIDWKAGGCFRGYESAARLVRLLGRRRRGEVDPDEPTGLLSHHLDMDEAAWDFLARFLDLTKVHSAACWRTPADLFRGGAE
jgi:hypothetical protein